MPQINGLIPESAFEIIGERLPVILADELPNQANQANESYFNAKIYHERVVEVDSSELTSNAVVITTWPRGEYDFQTPLTHGGNYTFFIDAYVKASFSQTERGDTAAYIKLQRLLGIIKGIFQAPEYITLGFDPPFIEHRSVQDIKTANPSANDRDNMVFGRVTLLVRAPDSSEPQQPATMAGYHTQVKMSETDFGYLYSSDQSQLPNA